MSESARSAESVQPKPSRLRLPELQTGKLLALAPMQDVTDWGFWNVIRQFGGPDIYFTEYVRVLTTSRVDRDVRRAICENPTGKPAVAQMIGNCVDSLVRVARELQQLPVAAIDLNLGCPAPVVYRKCAGGGLLRDPDRIDKILHALRDAITIPFTVKTRIGFESPDEFDRLLEVFQRHALDLLTVHGRTVAERYRSAVHYDRIADAVRHLPFPVIANGNIASARDAISVLSKTGASGVMIGRGAIRNPWIFLQARALFGDTQPALPTGHDVMEYIGLLFEAGTSTDASESQQVQKMKKTMNFLALGVEPTGEFLHRIRRVSTRSDFFRCCEDFLDHDSPLPLEPFAIELKESDSLAGNHCG